jgi:hypothetical protein
MENSVEVEADDDSGVLKFNVYMTVDTLLDQYLVWRLKDILQHEEDPRIRRACHELLVYVKTPAHEDD